MIYINDGSLKETRSKEALWAVLIGKEEEIHSQLIGME